MSTQVREWHRHTKACLFEGLCFRERDGVAGLMVAHGAWSIRFIRHKIINPHWEPMPKEFWGVAHDAYHSGEAEVLSDWLIEHGYMHEPVVKFSCKLEDRIDATNQAVV